MRRAKIADNAVWYSQSPRLGEASHWWPATALPWPSQSKCHVGIASESTSALNLYFYHVKLN